MAEAYDQRARWVEQVRRYEAEAAADPAGFQRKVRRAIALGYWMTAGLLLAALAVIVAMAYVTLVQRLRFPGRIWIVIAAVTVFYGVLAGLLRRGEASTHGIEATPEGYPRLWDEVRRIAATLGVENVRTIRFGVANNAGAGQVTPFGVVGRPANHLYIGLPLASALSPDELRSVIAHELGHFAGQHGATSGRLATVCRAWQDGLTRSWISSLVLAPLFQWYATRLSAMDTALARPNEFEADGAARRAAGRAAATALLRLPAVDLLYSRERSRLTREMTQSGAPASDTVERLCASVREPLPPEEFAKELKASLQARAELGETHPTLLERVVALGEPQPDDLDADVQRWAQELSTPPNPSAVEVLLTPDELNRAKAELQRVFETNTKDNWARERVLDSAAGAEVVGNGESSVVQRFERLFDSGEPGLEELAEEVLREDPGHQGALMVRGHSRRHSDPAGAIADFQAAAASPGKHQADALSRALSVAEAVGDDGTAKKLYEQLMHLERLDEDFYLEALRVPASARAWAVPEPAKRQALESLGRSRRVAKVFAVEFPSRVKPGILQQHLYILPRFGPMVSSAESLGGCEAEAEAIHTNWIILQYDQRKVAKQLEAIPGAELWSRR